ncbi:sigma-70 family RNA polymerase sigma factor [Nannocystis sp. ILAH1]|uniref:RNA polymerase sigma factor n=1 Tax=unclassified Nannocystis TaxID=2627009 RepID=UPI00226E5DF3|nr:MULTISPECIES: sigma-70 family RNA polymerase sigma factor [unclassified Nannocystis]MCY0992534.1 sigma-70 family RNA polymerase sigma factor [Nannocystis sp. ILAH1]MCY1070240.1 sigma-70 family RNA polymerase sigma factor [Nannocystis sp. RBIL2]
MPTSRPAPPVETLLALMQSGDLRALDHLARAYGERLLAVARRRCDLPEDAEDAVQQALLAAGAAMTGYRGEGSPLAWLSTLVTRTCWRLNRKATRTADVADVPCTCDDPAEVAERRELGATLGDALMTLSRTDRLAFLLAAEGCSSVEIAERFSLTHDAVRSRLKRARKVLRAALENRDTPPARGRTASASPTQKGSLPDDDLAQFFASPPAPHR